MLTCSSKFSNPELCAVLAAVAPAHLQCATADRFTGPTFAYVPGLLTVCLQFMHEDLSFRILFCSLRSLDCIHRVVS